MLRQLFWRCALAVRGLGGSSVPQSRVDLPTFHRTDTDVLRQLRDIRWALDYFVTNQGRVLLLEYQPGKPRIADGWKRIAWGIDNDDSRLMAQGFALLDDLPGRALSNGLLVLRAKQLLHVGESDVRFHRKRLLAEADGTAADARGEAHFRDALHSDYRSDHAILLRHRKSFLSAGIPT